MVGSTWSFAFQHICDKCLKGFISQKRLQTHRKTCAQCPKCGEWVETRHISRCNGKRDQRNRRVICYLCDQLRVRRDMKRHMLAQHGVKDWAEDPLRPLTSEVSCC